MNATIGSSLSRSLVAELGDDCAMAAQLAAAMADRSPAGTIDASSLPSMPRPTLARIAADFVRRGWLTPIASGWRIGPGSLPPAVIPFLDGAAAMRSQIASRETATAIVTMPPLSQRHRGGALADLPCPRFARFDEGRAADSCG
jgi:hypothetical protein